MKRICSRLILLCLFVGLRATAQTIKSDEPTLPASCKVLFSMVEEDSLHNLNQGIVAAGIKQKDGLKWLEKMYKKYPDVCYVAPNTQESVVFFITATPAVYHGTRVITQSHNTQSNTTGTVTDNDGNSADLDATTTGTTESSVAVPYEVNYNSYMLTIERRLPNEQFRAVRRFKIEGLYHVTYGFSWGKGKHPLANVMEDAIKWIHDGGLNNSLQTVAQ